MSDDDKRVKLPALIVQPAGYELIDEFARFNRMSKSEAIRQLLTESPRLREYAAQHGHDLASLTVKNWGGQSKEQRGDE